MLFIYLSSVKLFSFLIKYHILIYFIFLALVVISLKYIRVIIILTSPIIWFFWNLSFLKLNKAFIFIF